MSLGWDANAFFMFFCILLNFYNKHILLPGCRKINKSESTRADTPIGIWMENLGCTYRLQANRPKFGLGTDI